MPKAFRVYGAASFGSAIVEFRTQRGLSQGELAARAGIHRSYLSDLERGKVTEQVERLVRVLDSLGVQIRLEAEDDA